MKGISMVKSVAKTVMWAGRATVFLVGLAVILALVLGAASTALGADGKPFLLGDSNVATKVSTLVKRGAGPALELRVGSGAPLKVNSSQKVARLNADQVDGMSANGVVRVASASADQALVGGSGDVLSTSIVAPSRGFLIMNASTDVAASGDDLVVCSLEVDGEDIASTDRVVGTLDIERPSLEEICSTNGTVPVKAGRHTVDFEAIMGSGTRLEGSNLDVLFVPFDGAGRQP
jgi:hypothetical protein